MSTCRNARSVATSLPCIKSFNGDGIQVAAAHDKRPRHACGQTPTRFAKCYAAGAMKEAR